MGARLVVGVSGASGAPLALRLLLLAQECGLGVELIVTPGGARTLREECGLGPEDLAQYAEAVYDCADLAAPPSSGSHPTLGMAVVRWYSRRYRLGMRSRRALRRQSVR